VALDIAHRRHATAMTTDGLRLLAIASASSKRPGRVELGDVDFATSIAPIRRAYTTA